MAFYRCGRLDFRSVRLLDGVPVNVKRNRDGRIFLERFDDRLSRMVIGTRVFYIVDFGVVNTGKAVFFKLFCDLVADSYHVEAFVLASCCVPLGVKIPVKKLIRLGRVRMVNQDGRLAGLHAEVCLFL